MMDNSNTLAEILTADAAGDVAAYVLFKFKHNSVEFELKSKEHVAKLSFDTNLSLDDINLLFDDEFYFQSTRLVMHNFFRDCKILFESPAVN